MSKSLLLFPLMLAGAFAAVDGTVINQTAGQPQAGAMVTVYQMGQEGMKPVKTVKSDESGKFHIDGELQGAHLVQTIFSGVVYNQVLTPGTPMNDVRVDVYDASDKPGTAAVAQHMVLLEPSADHLIVSETYFYRNEGKVTYNDPKNGTLQVFLPEASKGIVRVSIQGPQSVPIQRSAEKTSTANVYKIDYPIKPGETRIDLTYVLPSSTPSTFEGKILYKGNAPTRLVVPSGVTLKGDNLESLGQEPSTQASIYDVKAASYKVEVEGVGTLQQAGGQEPGGGEEDGAPGIEQISAPIYGKMTEILVLSFLILGLGFVLLYRSNRSAAAPAASGTAGEKRRS